MKKFVKIILLIDIYSVLLTKKRNNILNLYYNKDYSLKEISEFLNITKQAVRDSLIKGEKSLFNFEKKLNILKKILEQDELIKNILKKNINNFNIYKKTLNNLIYYK